MSFQVVANYKVSRGHNELIVATAPWITALHHAIEQFHALYNTLCHQVGDSLDTFLQVGCGPIQPVPILLFDDTLHDDYYPALCKAGHDVKLVIDGGDTVTIRHYKVA